VVDFKLGKFDDVFDVSIIGDKVYDIFKI